MRSKDSCPVLRGLGDSNVFRLPDSLLEQEHLRVILLDRRNRVMDTVEVYHGSVNSAQVRVGEVFKDAVARMASAIIVVHSHPSGDPTPSPEDVAVTRAIVQAGKLLDIDTLDRAPWKGVVVAL
jgi:DNA repair protein RadC